MTSLRPREEYKTAATYAAVKWAASNPERVREYKRAYKARHAERVRAGEWDRDNRRILNRLVISARARAKSKGIEFSITADDLELPSHCPVLAMPFVRVRGQWSGASPSIDRKDPSLGYVKGNVQIMSRLANTMKSNASPEQMRAFAAWVGATYGTGD